MTLTPLWLESSMSDRTVIRVLPGSAEEHADLIGHRFPTLTS